MKQFIYNKVVLPVCLAVVALLSSCSAFDDFLTVYPTNQITGEQFWEDRTDLESVLFSCYKQLTTEGMSQRMFVWGEARADNFIMRDADDEDLVNLMNANLLPQNVWFNWATFYKEIAYCNLVLAHGSEIVAKDNSFSEGDWLPIEAEVKTLRAMAYFYLIRTFGNVPLTVSVADLDATGKVAYLEQNNVPYKASSDVSEGVRDTITQADKKIILNWLIDDVDAIKDNAMTNYANDVDNHGRITKNAVYALLADMYLWRTCLEGTYKSKSDLVKVNQLCDAVIDDMNLQFLEKGQEHYGVAPHVGKIELPLYTFSERFDDTPYNEIFGNKNSLESIFEVQHSSTGGYNQIVPKFLGGWDSGKYSSGLFMPSGIYGEIESKDVHNPSGYFKTDIRCFENFKNAASGGATVSTDIYKFTVTKVTTKEPTDITKKNAVDYNSSYRNKSTCDANNVIYRASDVILMRAEATCLMLQNCDKAEKDSIRKIAFDHVYAVFFRSNPQLEPKNQFDESYFEEDDKGAELLDFIYQERQREFFGEGKRWFDLVKMTHRSGNTSKALALLSSKYTSNASAIKAKMSTIPAMYSPVYKNEMKVNPALIQSSVWKDNETSERN